MAVIPFVSQERDPSKAGTKRADYRRVKRQADKDVRHRKKEAYNKKCEENRKKGFTRKQIRELKKNKNLVQLHGSPLPVPEKGYTKLSCIVINFSL